jgi:ELWxxDGT repeat protein
MRKKLLSFFNVYCALKDFARVLTLSFVMSLFIWHETFAQAQLIKDLDTTEEPTFNEYSQLMNAGIRMYFVSNNELWKSIGTSGSTLKLRAFKSISNLTQVGSFVFFTADDGITGLELWRSDGSVPGTVRVKDIISGSGSSLPSDLTACNGFVFFVANNNTNGRELWKSDGTAAGTVMVKDILKASGTSKPSFLTDVNGTLFFSANDGTNGYELWKSDGTTAGTVMVKDIKTGSKLSSSPTALVNVNGVLYFSASDNTTGAELWKSDGTASGTLLVKDVRAGSSGSGIENTINVNGTLFFTANDGTHGDELWKSNGTSIGTVLVKDMNPGSAGSNSTDGFSKPMGDFTNINGILYFFASRGWADFIYRSDGTAAGTFTVAEAHGVSINRAKPEFTYMNGKVYFLNTGTSEYVYKLWSMDYNGTVPTVIESFWIPEDYYMPYDQELIAFNNTLYTYGRLVDPNVYEQTSTYKFYRSNGTPGGISVVKDALVSTWGSSVREMISLNDTYVYMQGQSFLSDYQHLWVTDGTNAGTRQIGSMDWDHEWEVVGDWLYYTHYGNEAATRGEWQLWRTHGPVETNAMITNQNGPDDQSFPRGMTAVGNALYYYDNAGGLWKSEGTATIRLRDFDEVYSITDVNGTAFIITSEGLWKSTASGLQLVKFIESSLQAAQATIAYHNIFYFSAYDDHGYEVWRSDGTAAGTYRYADLNSYEQESSNDLRFFVEYKDALYVGAMDATGDGLIKLTGRDTFEKIHGFDYPIDNVAEVNGRLVMFVFEGLWMKNHEVWSTDGTSDGLKYLTETWVAIDVPWVNPVAYQTIGNALFFGSEYSTSMYRTDGYCAEEVTTGVYGAYAMERLGTSLIFSGTSPVYGNEPYIYRNIPTQSPCADGSTVAARQFAEAGQDKAIMTPYPNPFTQDFTMRIDGADRDVAEVSVFSTSGMPIEKFESVKTNTDYSNIGSTWPKGIYVVKVNKGGTLTTHMVVKK